MRLTITKRYRERSTPGDDEGPVLRVFVECMRIAVQKSVRARDVLRFARFCACEESGRRAT